MSDLDTLLWIDPAGAVLVSNVVSLNQKIMEKEEITKKLTTTPTKCCVGRD